eukprot:101978_1
MRYPKKYEFAGGTSTKQGFVVLFAKNQINEHFTKISTDDFTDKETEKWKANMIKHNKELPTRKELDTSAETLNIIRKFKPAAIQRQHKRLQQPMNQLYSKGIFRNKIVQVTVNKCILMQSPFGEGIRHSAFRNKSYAKVPRTNQHRSPIDRTKRQIFPIQENGYENNSDDSKQKDIESKPATALYIPPIEITDKTPGYNTKQLVAPEQGEISTNKSNITTDKMKDLSVDVSYITKDLINACRLNQNDILLLLFHGSMDKIMANKDGFFVRVECGDISKKK